MEGVKKVNFLDKKCLEEGHSDQTLIASCIDKNCTVLNKFVRVECMFNTHEQHKIIKLKQIQDKMNDSLDDSFHNKGLETIKLKLKDTEDKIQQELEIIKTNILEIMNNKTNNFTP